MADGSQRPASDLEGLKHAMRRIKTRAGSVLPRLRLEMPHLRRSEQRVAKVILAAPEQVVYSSITEVAAEARCSDATVLRLCRALGFNGFQEFKLALSRELVMPERFLHQDIHPDDPLDVAIQKTYAANMRALEDTLAALDMNALVELIHAVR